MKISYLSINDAAIRSGLSQIQIFALLRNNVLKSSVKDNRIVVEQRILKRWLNKNPNLVTELKKDVDNRIFFINLYNYFNNSNTKTVN